MAGNNISERRKEMGLSGGVEEGEDEEGRQLGWAPKAMGREFRPCS